MRRLLALTSFLAAIGCCAVPAHADAGQDQAFLVSLGAAGITFKDPPSAITAGKTVCELAEQGKTGVEVVKIIQGANPGLSQDNAARFTAIAAHTYCPSQLPAATAASEGS
ncbi:DUF732 domain-containing protein [Mycobacterium vicinigordonae]|uniref:DUF732 domain-containing protein n=1 Tax=Mycobacterium vicinigordonae TaxID=1719132 RepID=A0A7D6IB83_9MYCO|nr:DUF732 domain-containing protein [Mycobacterium vicinigordonae]QLL09397.1 DUF732 domain-containing protein [Mycobacterium vicinigordonae]